MNQINIYEAKKNFSVLLKKVQHGETIIISSRNEPVAELKPIRKKPSKNRPFGLAKGDFTVPRDINEPLPAEFLEAFYGK